MNLTDAQQRAIYEWLKPELKARDWRFGDVLQGRQLIRVYAWFVDDGPHGKVTLPPLDMNLAHGEVMPKLHKEGTDIDFYYANGGGWWTFEHGYEGCDFYEGLLQYLGVK
jgi:hypothetical protein